MDLRASLEALAAVEHWAQALLAVDREQPITVAEAHGLAHSLLALVESHRHLQHQVLALLTPPPGEIV